MSAVSSNLIVHSGTSRCMRMGSGWHPAPLASSTSGPVSAAGKDRRGLLAYVGLDGSRFADAITWNGPCSDIEDLITANLPNQVDASLKPPHHIPGIYGSVKAHPASQCLDSVRKPPARDWLSKNSQQWLTLSVNRAVVRQPPQRRL